MPNPWSNQIVQLIIIASPATGFTGLFVYSPTPAQNNLIASIAASAGTDPFNNSYDQGITSYLFDVSFSSTVQLNGAQIIFNWANGSSGTVEPATAFPSISVGVPQVPGAAPNLIIAGPSANASAVFPIVIIQGESEDGTNKQLVEFSNSDNSALPLFLQGVASSTPATPNSGVILFSNANGDLIALGSDGNAYNTQRLTNVTTSTITINSTSPIVIVSVPSVLARTYRVHIQITYVGGTTAASAVLGWDGTSTIGTSLGTVRRARSSTNADLVSPINQAGGVGNLTLAFNVGESETYEFDGVITFTAAGSFNVRGQESVAGDTWAVGVGSYVELMPVG